MINRSQHLTFYTICIGLLFLSIGFNVTLMNKVNRFKDVAPVSDKELKDLTKEIKRLSNLKYDVKTRKMIDGFEIHTK